MTESSKSPPRPRPSPASAPDAAPAGATASHGPPPPPRRAGTGTAPLPAAVVLPPPAGPGSEPPREEARDTLAPSSFGNLGSRPHAAPAPTGMRSARAPMPTLGELEGVSATATLRPPGAVPPPPRALPTATPSPDPVAFERAPVLETPLPLPASSVTKPVELESTLDMSGSASKKATQAALIEQTRRADGAVPAPGLYIADEPLEPRPKQASMVTVQRRELSRLRGGMLVLGGLLLMAAGALAVMIFRRAEASASRQIQASAASPSAAPRLPPGCALQTVPSRIATIERSVPIAVRGVDGGGVALAFAETKTSAAQFLFRPSSGDAERQHAVPAGAEITHVALGDPPVVSRASAEFAFAQALAPGLELGVGASGILRRGADGATGVVWPLPAGARVTPPRVAALASGYFVTFRQGGAEGQIVSGWVRQDGSAASELTPLSGVPRQLGTPTATLLGTRAALLVAARESKGEPYRVYTALAAPGAPATAQVLDAPAEGGGAIAPSLAALPGGRYLLQWTDGSVGQYQVHARLLDQGLAPLAPAFRVSAKGANAGQGLIVGTARGAVSFFIQTTAGHDELWGVSLSCH